MTEQDGSVITTQYPGNQTMVTDEAGKVRTSTTDAAGRLTQVVEDPSGLNYLTAYTYDALDDLKTVNQGAQARSFTYDSLKRLLSATNPESGTVNYTSYDANGNLRSKTDARGIITNYQYDALNRLTNRSYQNDPSNTPAVSYTYDAAGFSNSKGRLTKVNSTVSMTNYTGYDAMGRVSGSSQVTNAQTYSFAYGYNLAGGMTSETYPSGRTVLTGYDTAGWVNGVTGSGSKTYASSFFYWPHGAVNSMTLGNSLVETTVFGPRLQPTSIAAGTLLSLVYNYGSTNNNGNVVSQAITAGSFSATQIYGYDGVNRLTSASEGSNWTETYGYDPYGNRTNVSVSSSYLPTYAPAPSMDGANKNRFATSAGFAYDNAGNLTQAPVVPGGATQTFGYDAENNLINFNSAAATYAYDGDGRRVQKGVGSSTTVFVYDATGKLAAEYSNTSTTGSGTKYITADHLGSTRVVTDASGAVLARHDYLPFGEEIPALFGNRSSVTGYNNSDDTRQKFTGKERDSESGLDYYLARYHGSSLGRFTSPDPEQASGFLYPDDPQSWNGYAYARNNPLKMVDSAGFAYCAAPGGSGGVTPATDQQACEGNGGKWVLESGDPQTVQNESGDTATVPTQSTTVNVNGDTGETSIDTSFLDSSNYSYFLVPARNWFTLGVRAPGQTWKQCMSANSGNYSIGGAFGFNSGVAKFALGNDVSQILFGDSSEGSGGLALWEGGSHSVKGGVGKVMTAGRRTASIFDLNLSGKTGPAPRILGKTGAESLAGWLTGLAELKMAADVGLTGAQAIGCLIPR